MVTARPGSRSTSALIDGFAPGSVTVVTLDTAEDSADMEHVIQGIEAECLAIDGPATFAELAIETALERGHFKCLGTIDTVYAPMTLEAAEYETDGLLVASPFLPQNDSSDEPTVRTFLQEARQVDPDFVPTNEAATVYAALMALAPTGDGPNPDGTSLGSILGLRIDATPAQIYLWRASAKQFVLLDPQP